MTYYEEKKIEVYNHETRKQESVSMYRTHPAGGWLYVTEEMKSHPKSQWGYYCLDKEGCFTNGSPYRYRESAVSEAKEIHGKGFVESEHVEEHITDAFYTAFLESL